MAGKKISLDSVIESAKNLTADDMKLVTEKLKQLEKEKRTKEKTDKQMKLGKITYKFLRDIEQNNYDDFIIKLEESGFIKAPKNKETSSSVLQEEN